tara:strand:- start:7011 stop:8000 length:990 start_codon:yes stop_codon:yes gene_type:complete
MSLTLKSDEDFIKIVKSSTTWNEIILKCGLKVMTRTLQRRINNLCDENKNHLPKFYGGLYSKIGKNSNDYYKELLNKYDNWDDILKELNFTTLQCLNNLKKHLDIIGFSYDNIKNPTQLKQKNKISLDDILIEDSLYTNMTVLKNRLISELQWKYECVGCNNFTYSNNWVKNVPIPLEIDHINGVHSDNRIENLRFLCPNCHSMTDTYKGKNMKKTVDNKKEKESIEYMVKNIINNILKNVEKNIKEKEIKCIDCDKIITRGHTRCVTCNDKHKFNNTTSKKVQNRPTLEQLEKDLIELKNNYCAIGRKYGVSDNCIRKWIKKYKNMLD